MNINVVKEKAKKIGIKETKLGKRELIRAIQRQEGNSACFATEIAPVCGQKDCFWREDCVPNTAS